MTKICYEISCYEGSILDNIERGVKLPFIPGGPIEKTACIYHLSSFGLIVTDATKPSGYDTTAAGRAVCSILFAEGNAGVMPRVVAPVIEVNLPFERVPTSENDPSTVRENDN